MKNPGRYRIRRMLKWAGLMLCLLLFGVYYLWPWTPPALVPLHLLLGLMTVCLWLADLPRRRRRLFKRGCLLLSACLIVLWGVSHVWSLTFYGERWSVSLVAGRAQLESGDPVPDDVYAAAKLVAASWADLHYLIKLGFTSSLTCRAETPSGNPLTIYSLPLFVGILTVGFFAIVLAIVDRCRGLPGHCGNCGYNLTGIVSGVCPECGAESIAAS